MLFIIPEDLVGCVCPASDFGMIFDLDIWNAGSP